MTAYDPDRIAAIRRRNTPLPKSDDIAYLLDLVESAEVEWTTIRRKWWPKRNREYAMWLDPKGALGTG